MKKKEKIPQWRMDLIFSKVLWKIYKHTHNDKIRNLALLYSSSIAPHMLLSPFCRKANKKYEENHLTIIVKANLFEAEMPEAKINKIISYAISNADTKPKTNQKNRADNQSTKKPSSGGAPKHNKP